MPPVASTERPKKPRNRHSPHQLAALNELYERDEHPSLEMRTSLAERLGMETKTVNSWFQNKRASTKKRTVSVKSVSHHANRINSSRPSHSSSTSSTPRPSESGDYPDDDYVATPAHHLSRTPDESHDLSENESMARRLRARPSAEQTDALIKAFSENSNPTSDQRQVLADSLEMPYQSVTNWFQSNAKKHNDDQPSESRAYAAFPPPSKHPSLALPPATQHPSLAAPQSRRSPSVYSSVADEPSPSKRSSRRSGTPYSMSMASRLRRARPEPQQLDALKDLFLKNPTPTIEQRTALALEIGMDLGKVTNWFRNLRQTSRRRAKKVMDDDDDYGYSYPHRHDPSRSTSPSSGSSVADDHEPMDYDEDSHMAGPHSDVGSDDEYQEAVTPSPPPSPIHPKVEAKPEPEAPRHRLDLNSLSAFALDYAEGEKAAMKFSSGIKYEDALLLVSFSRQYVH